MVIECDYIKNPKSKWEFVLQKSVLQIISFMGTEVAAVKKQGN